MDGVEHGRSIYATIPHIGTADGIMTLLGASILNIGHICQVPFARPNIDGNHEA